MVFTQVFYMFMYLSGMYKFQSLIEGVCGIKPYIVSDLETFELTSIEVPSSYCCNLLLQC